MNKKYFNIFDYLVTKNGKAKTITKEKNHEDSFILWNND